MIAASRPFSADNLTQFSRGRAAEAPSSKRTSGDELLSSSTKSPSSVASRIVEKRSEDFSNVLARSRSNAKPTETKGPARLNGDSTSQEVENSSLEEREDFDSRFKKLAKDKRRPSTSDASVQKAKVKGEPIRDIQERDDLESRAIKTKGLESQTPVAFDRSRFIDSDAPFFIEVESVDSPQLANQTIQEFVTAMDQELGVEPDELIAAFKKLDPQVLGQTPEESMPQVLNELDLSEADTLRAKNLYSQMVQKLEENNEVASFETVRPEQLKKQQTLSKLEKLSTSFFLNDRRLPYSAEEIQMADKAFSPVVAGPASAAAAANTTTADARAQTDNEESADSKDNENASGRVAYLEAGEIPTPNFPTKTPDGLTPQSVRPLRTGLAGSTSLSAVTPSAVESYKPQAFDSSSKVTEGRVLSTEATLEGLLKNLNVQAMNLSSGLEAGTPSVAPVGANLASAVETEIPRIAVLGRGAAEGSESGSEESLADGSESVMPSEIGMSGKPNNAELGKTEFAQKLGTPVADKNAELQPENSQLISDGAGQIAKKGGGQMKVKLNPEGLGDMDLKVLVKDGRVHVQMTAENLEAKKLLEQNVGELKKSLEAQNMVVDTIRIDTADNARLDSGLDSNEQSRNMARDFLGSFRDQNESFRQGFFDSPTLKEYRAPNDRMKDMESDEQVTPSRRPSSSRRLDLVA